MKKATAAFLLAMLLLSAVPGLAAARPTPEQVTETIRAKQEEYPENTVWERDKYYSWSGGIYEGGKGGMAFLFMVSDAAFGSLPARMVNPIDYEALRPGDILRVKNNTHSVMVMEVFENHVTVVETMVDRRNVNRIHWGRTLSKEAVLEGDYALTRYPGDGPAILPGDLTADGTVDDQDLLRLAKYLSGQPVEANAEAADVNEDGDIDGRDLIRLIKELAE